jgi:hypothetical protein
VKRYDLAPWQINAVLAFFMYHLTPEVRGKLMAQLPAIYNELCGDAIVKVVRVSDGCTMRGDDGS